jgi:hypothetical protein
MSNLVRNDLTIEGANVQQVLQAIGFNPGDAEAVLIDFNRITPRPNETPIEGWGK